MKNLIIGLILAGIMVASVSSAGAVGYSTGFDEYIPSQNLSGQDGGSGVEWDTNNFSDNGTPIDFSDDLGQSDFVGVISGYSVSGTDYWALLGGGIGVPPVVDTSFLFRPVDLTTAASAKFNVEFGIISSQSPNTNLDDFGWTFRDAAENQLLRVAFIPDLGQPGTLTIRVFDSANSELAGSGTQNLFYDSKYNLSVDISDAGIVSVVVTDQLGNPPDQIVTNQFAAGAFPNAIDNVAATWTLDDTTAAPNGERTEFGSNSLVFNNFSVVPEPSSALFAVGLVGVTVFRRFRVRVA